MTVQEHAGMLERLYCRLNRRRYVHPDPLEFLYEYDDQADRELVALVASSLAYGRVAQILKSVSAVLAILGPRPARCLMQTSPGQLRGALIGFRHRFAAGEHVLAMLTGAREVIGRGGSLQACFREGLKATDESVVPALRAFVGQLKEAAGGQCEHLLPDPADGSACKRLNLMLRWLVRSDRVDPGGWAAVGPEKLIIPLDTHMHRLALAMGMTRRKTADLRTALEVTDAFREIAPGDPVRYDFALTRLGIRNDMDIAAFIDGLSPTAKGKACA
ncbi:MAG: TIGR02757 family protein [Planctomycetes bacterium]|nr:TIGR02757 family protein [Planctomycetota bacterium]